MASGMGSGSESSIPSIHLEVSEVSIPSLHLEVSEVSIPSIHLEVSEVSIPSIHLEVSEVSIPSLHLEVSEVCIPSLHLEVSKILQPLTYTFRLVGGALYSWHIRRGWLLCVRGALTARIQVDTDDDFESSGANFNFVFGICLLMCRVIKNDILTHLLL